MRKVWAWVLGIFCFSSVEALTTDSKSLDRPEAGVLRIIELNRDVLVLMTQDSKRLVRRKYEHCMNESIKPWLWVGPLEGSILELAEQEGSADLLVADMDLQQAIQSFPGLNVLLTLKDSEVHEAQDFEWAPVFKKASNPRFEETPSKARRPYAWATSLMAGLLISTPFVGLPLYGTWENIGLIFASVIVASVVWEKRTRHSLTHWKLIVPPHHYRTGWLPWVVSSLSVGAVNLSPKIFSACAQFLSRLM